MPGTQRARYVEYLAADGLQTYIKGLYRAAGLFDASSHSGRRTFASRLMAAGQPLETVQALLGHSELDHLMPYLEVSKSTLREMFNAATVRKDHAADNLARP